MCACVCLHVCHCVCVCVCVCVGVGHRPYGPNELNGNGERLLDFCANNGFIVSNTWFQHKPIHQLTWYRNGDRSNRGHMIDLVLVNRRFRTSVLDTRVFRATHLQSDHELVVSTLRFKIKSKRQRQGCCTQVQTLDLPRELVSSFQTSLLEAHNRTLGRTGGVESTWTAFRESMDSAFASLPTVQR